MNGSFKSNFIPAEEEHLNARIILQHISNQLDSTASNIIVIQTEKAQNPRIWRLIQCLTHHPAYSISESVMIKFENLQLAFLKRNNLEKTLITLNANKGIEGEVDFSYILRKRFEERNGSFV